MRILIGMTRSDTLASGSFMHIVQIGERFRREGAKVRYVIGKSGPCVNYLESRGFHVYRLPSLERDLSAVKDALSLLQLLWIMLRFRPNLCSWHTAKIGALGRIASTLMFRKNFYIPHGVPFYECPQNRGYKKYRKLEKLLSYLPCTIVGVCAFDTAQYVRLGVPESRTVTIHNGMKRSSRGAKKASVRDDDRVVFATAARFEGQKDYETLALAVKHLDKLGIAFELNIYGDGPGENHVKTLFSGLSKASVKFNGVVQDLTVALKSADVFVLSSHWEGLPRTIIEAMSCGMPVIASGVGGVSELVEHGKSGYLVAPCDATGMASCMEAYIKDRDLLVRHGKFSHQRYEAKFTLDRMLNDYVVRYLQSGSAQAAVAKLGSVSDELEQTVRAESAQKPREASVKMMRENAETL